ncbi:MAG: hypothetical protein KAS92_04730 [Candidatus Omnitrophica bacterium]|nr:hypothetical protein [Candidatus Omnitrophota bacterium]
MSIINDALKKTQLSFKKKDKPPVQETKEEKPADQNTSNVYEKMYQKHAGQQSASIPGKGPIPGRGPVPPKSEKEVETDKKTAKLRSAKKWLKTSATVVIFLAVLSGGVFFALRLEPVQDFISSIRKESTSSRAYIAKRTPKKRTYKPGELVLNGTSLIDGKRVALINDEIYEIGETINGKKITSINLNQIKLSDNEKIITLRVH